MIKLNLEEISKILKCEYKGNSSYLLNNVNRLETANEKELTFYTGDKKFKEIAITSNAGCIIVPLNLNFDYKSSNLIYSENPYLSFINLLTYIDSITKERNEFFCEDLIKFKNCEFGSQVIVGRGSYIGLNCKIGDNTIIYPNATLLNNVNLGCNCIIYPNVVIEEGTIIGNGCIIHSGSVIGSDGFGYINNPDGTYIKIPQLGNVVIEDNVEIGANVTIDRALAGSTIIRKGVKIDNLVQVAHNVEIDENSAMASQVGIAGSTKIGKRVKLGGQVGIAGHITVADDVTLLAQSGIGASIEKEGVYFGSPARIKLEAFKIEATIGDLPQMAKDIAKLKRQIEEFKLGK